MRERCRTTWNKTNEEEKDVPAFLPPFNHLSFSFDEIGTMIRSISSPYSVGGGVGKCKGSFLSGLSSGKQKGAGRSVLIMWERERERGTGALKVFQLPATKNIYTYRIETLSNYFVFGNIWHIMNYCSFVFRRRRGYINSTVIKSQNPANLNSPFLFLNLSFFL